MIINVVVLLIEEIIIFLIFFITFLIFCHKHIILILYFLFLI